MTDEGNVLVLISAGAGTAGQQLLGPVGLVVDAVGALLLIRGLFRPLRGVYPGFSYGPDDAAGDAAFGVAGGLLLVAGFACQWTTYLAGAPRASTPLITLCSVGAMAAAAAFGYGAFGLTYIRVLNRKLAQAREKTPDLLDADARFFRRRRGFRFWSYSWDKPDGTSGDL